MLKSRVHWRHLLLVAALLPGLSGSLHTAHAGGAPISSISTGPDGNLWFTSFGRDTIGRITPTGRLTWVPLPAGISAPHYLTAGPDGNLWFSLSGAIGRISVDGGQVAEFFLPTAGQTASRIITGHDGNIWFFIYNNQGGQSSLGRITPGGQITEFRVPFQSSAGDVTAGSDGAVWLIDSNANKIDRLTPAGHLMTFLVPPAVAYLHGITCGPDGNLWFGASTAGRGIIGRLTPAGEVNAFPVTAGREVTSLTSGPGGAVWFSAGTSIGRISMQGRTTLYPLPLSDYPNTVGEGETVGIGAGPDGNVWFTFWSFYGKISIGKITPSGQATVYPDI